MLRLVLKLLNSIVESTMIWVLGGLLLCFAVAVFWVYKQTGEWNPKGVFAELFSANRPVSSMFELNPNLRYIRTYTSTRSLLQVRERDSGRTLTLDGAILDHTRLDPIPCTSVAALSSELYPGAFDLACFSLTRQGDREPGMNYRFAASFRAPAKVRAVGDYYSQRLRSRGATVSVVTDMGYALVVDGLQPGVGNVLRLAVRDYAGETRVFVAVPDPADAPPSSPPEAATQPAPQGNRE